MVGTPLALLLAAIAIAGILCGAWMPLHGGQTRSVLKGTKAFEKVGSDEAQLDFVIFGLSLSGHVPPSVHLSE
jgi:hypothetical protein